MNRSSRFIDMYGKKFIYSVWEGDDKIYEGDCYQIAEMFGISRLSVSAYARRKAVLSKKYLIKYEHKADSEVKPKPVLKKKTEEEKYMEYLETHLNVYGNVSISKDPIKYQGMLKEKGIDCNIREYYMLTSSIPTATAKAKRKGRTTKGYILERVNAT